MPTTKPDPAVFNRPSAAGPLRAPEARHSEKEARIPRPRFQTSAAKSCGAGWGRKVWSGMEAGARVRGVPAAGAELSQLPTSGVLSVPDRSSARWPRAGDRPPDASYLAASVASRHSCEPSKTCRSQPGLPAFAGAPPARPPAETGRRGERGSPQGPERFRRCPARRRCPGTKAKYRLHPGFMSTQRAEQRLRSSRPELCPLVRLALYSLHTPENGLAPWGAAAEG